MKKIIIGLLALAIFTTGCDNETTEVNVETEETLAFTYMDVEVTPGVEFINSNMAEDVKYVELPSCAFEGNDRVYTYEDVELTVSSMDGIDTVYSVYFLTDQVETEEGVKLADDKSVMIEAYGEDYVQVNNQYKYLVSNTLLLFIVENDVVTSIEYKYNN